MKVELLSGVHNGHQKGEVFEMPANCSFMRETPYRFRVIPGDVPVTPGKAPSPDVQTPAMPEKQVVSDSPAASADPAKPAATVASAKPKHVRLDKPAAPAKVVVAPKRRKD